MNILVDHNQYFSTDRVDDILDQICHFARTEFAEIGPTYGFGRLEIRQFKSGGIEAIDINDPQRFGTYDRKGMPYPDACREYRRANIFFVTKPESMGLSIIECAMSGALIVVPKGFAKPNLMEPLNHIVWEHQIDFGDILASLNVGRSAQNAAPYCWQRLAQSILNTLRLHESGLR